MNQSKIIFSIRKPSDIQFGSQKKSDCDFGSYRVLRFGFFTPDDIEATREGKHCFCAHDCCGCWQIDAYFQPLIFNFGYVEEHHYMNV